MPPASFLLLASALLPATLMCVAMPHLRSAASPAAWGRFSALAVAALASTVASLGLQLADAPIAPGPGLLGLGATLTGAWVAVLVQLLGTVIGVFSSRYLRASRASRATWLRLPACWRPFTCCCWLTTGWC